MKNIITVLSITAVLWSCKKESPNTGIVEPKAEQTDAELYNLIEGAWRLKYYFNNGWNSIENHENSIGGVIYKDNGIYQIKTLPQGLTSSSPKMWDSIGHYKIKDGWLYNSMLPPYSSDTMFIEIKNNSLKRYTKGSMWLDTTIYVRSKEYIISDNINEKIQGRWQAYSVFDFDNTSNWYVFPENDPAKKTGLHIENGKITNMLNWQTVEVGSIYNYSLSKNRLVIGDGVEYLITNVTSLFLDIRTTDYQNGNKQYYWQRFYRI